MTNFIYLSPNFPANHWNFCNKLKENGINVLGIGDCPYDNLTDELKGSLNEYYKVSSLENYDEVYRAVAFFCFKYGKVDYIETNNEYWLERDARLRTDFNVNTGFHSEDMDIVKFKSRMKENYIKAGVPVARYHMVDDYEGCLKFIEEVGYPLVAKPDNGVGANDTHKIKNEDDLKKFFETKLDVQYIMEEYIFGEVHTYDCIVNSKGEPLFETGNVTIGSLMDIVNNSDNCALYIRATLPEKLLKAGRATVKAFGVKSRFCHLEFFQLSKDQHIGKKGEYVALEVNMRPSGGISPTMMNYANGTDVYKIWADMIAFDRSTKDLGERSFCGFIGRRDGKTFQMSDDELQWKYANQLRMVGRIPDALSGAMGNRMFVGCFPTEEAMNAFYADAVR
jgi:hypothetical protein